jgi:hypothetical protein
MMRNELRGGVPMLPYDFLVPTTGATRLREQQCVLDKPISQRYSSHCGYIFRRKENWDGSSSSGL